MAATVDSTGIVNGAIITGRPGAKQTVGMTLQVRGSSDVIYPPSRAAVAVISADTSGVWYGKLSQLPQFTGWQWSHMVAWLQQHVNRMTSDDVYLEGMPIRIRFISIGGDYITSVWPANVIMAVLAGESVLVPAAPGVTTTQLIPDADGYYSIQDVFNAFPRKVTASGVSRRGTLLFRPHNWMCVPQQHESLTPGDVCIYQDGTVHTITQPTTVSHSVRVMRSVLPLHLVWQHGQTPSPELLQQLAHDYRVTECLPWLSWMTPGQLKSLLQKLIRQGGDAITVPGEAAPVHTDRLLVATWLQLLCHPGGLVPDLQRFVTGAESALKRAVVSICEDGYVTQTQWLALMMVWASIIQAGHKVLPSTDVLREFIATLITARMESRSYVWDTHYPQLHLGYVTTPLGMILELLHGMGSFKSDIAMVSSMLAANGAARPPLPILTGYVTPIYHCLDHHCNPEIGYLIPALPQEWTQDYSALFSEIFTTVTGVNPRRTVTATVQYGTLTSTDAVPQRVAAIRNAQQQLWHWFTQGVAPAAVIAPPTDGVLTSYAYTRTMEWLPAYIGVIDYTVRGVDYLVTMRSDGDWMIMRKPKRGEKSTVDDSRVDSDVRDWISSQLDAQVEAGVWCTDPLSSVTLTLQRRPDGYYLNGVAWQQATTIMIQCAPLPTSLDQLGVDVMVVRRALGTILSRITPVLSMYKISREGHGQDFVVKRIDSEVYRLMCVLAQRYNTLLQHTTVTSWTVLNHAGVLLLVAALRMLVTPGVTRARDALVTPGVTGRAPLPVNPDTRQLYQHQRQAVNDMLQSPRGSIIWINVGMGKTLIVMTYLREVAIPFEYVIYTLPKSAIDSVTQEIVRTGFQVQVLTSHQYTPVPLTHGVVNLIEHDQLRSTDLTPYMPTSLMVVDEFHKTLNHTQRTSMAQELASLALRFVAMSGTIADTNNLDDLTRWLSMVVPYPISGRLPWVALNTMISKIANTGVLCHRHHIAAVSQMPVEYYQLVSPALGGTNTRAGPKEFTDAVTMCHDVCVPKMVDVTLDFLRMSRNVFMVAKDESMLERIYNMLLQRGLRADQIALMTGGGAYLPAGHPGPEVVALTTVRHNAGYTITKMSVMVTSVFFSGQNTRTQLEGRINRIGQPLPIDIIVVYAGLLEKILSRYEDARSLAEALTALSTL